MSATRQANPIPEIPLNVPTEAGNTLWTPSGLEHVQSWVVGKVESTGARVFKHEFRLTFKGEVRYFGIVAHENASPDQIEDLAAGMVEREAKRILDELQKRGSKLVPEEITNNIPIRRELAAVMRDYIRHARRRAKTTTGRLYQVVA